MRNVNEFTIKPGSVVSFEVKLDRVRVKLASGHCMTWPNRSGITIFGGEVLTGIQADKDDCETVDGVSIRGSDGGVWSGLTECRVCHAYNKAGTVCECQEKRDETAKRLEGVKAE
jgi:hypothetical protein